MISCCAGELSDDSQSENGSLINGMHICLELNTTEQNGINF